MSINLVTLESESRLCFLDSCTLILLTSSLNFNLAIFYRRNLILKDSILDIATIKIPIVSEIS